MWMLAWLTVQIFGTSTCWTAAPCLWRCSLCPAGWRSLECKCIGRWLVGEAWLMDIHGISWASVTSLELLQNLLCTCLACTFCGAKLYKFRSSLRAHFVMEPNSTLHQPLGCTKLPGLYEVMKWWSHGRMIPEGHNAFVYILDGEGIFAGETADRHHCLILSHEVGEDGVSVAILYFTNCCILQFLSSAVLLLFSCFCCWSWMGALPSWAIKNGWGLA